MKHKRTVLKNGMRIITVPMKDNPTVTVLVLVEAGSKYETKKLNGISHFLEHMCFKGTVKRPTALHIAHELDGLGADYNAFTTEEYTGYYAKGEARYFPKLLDVVSDIYQNSTFPEKEIEKEKGVIVEEINMYEDMPARDVQQVFTSLLYGDQPAGWSVAGTKENVKSFKREDFINYKDAHYVASATTIVVAGNISHVEALNQIKSQFKTIPGGKKTGKKKVSDSQTKPSLAIKYKKTDQAHVVLGVRTYPIAHKDIPTLVILSTLLGGSMSSRLFQKLREDMGVAYYVRANNETHSDHGFFEIAAGIDKNRVVEVMQVVLAECRKLQSEPVAHVELKKVKDYLIGTIKLGLETSDAIAQWYGGQEVMHRPLLSADMVAKKFAKVTVRDIQKVATNIFSSSHLNLAIVGPYTDSSPYKQELRF